MTISTNFSYNRNIPSISTKKSSPATTNFAKGIFSYRPNDVMEYDQIYLAQDARFDKVGEYRTRTGLDKLAEPLGKAVLYSGYSTTYTMQSLPISAVTYTATADAIIYSVRITALSTDTTNYGVLQVTLKVGGQVVGTSCIDPADVGTTATDLEAMFINAPSVKSGDVVTISVGLQGSGTRAYQVATISNNLMYDIYTCTAGAVTSVFEANIDGTKTLLFVQNNVLYRMDEATQVVTSIRTLPTGAGVVRFNQDLNQIRYVDGVEGPRLLNPANSWSDTAITTVDLKTDIDLEIKTSNIMDGLSDNIMYFDADTNTQAIWTYPYGFTWFKSAIFTTTTTLGTIEGNTTSVRTSTLTATTSQSTPVVGDRMTDPADTTGEITAISGTTLTVKTITSATVIDSYDKFDRDFRQNFPAILTGDPLTAMFNLGGVIYIMTRRNKYQMFVQTADTWSQSQSQAQNGTFSQESIVCDLNYAYFANDNGIYVFDGSSEASLTQDTIQNVYDNIPYKDNIRLDLYRNRLYCFYASTASGPLDHCLVYNISLKLWESFDSNTYISATSARQNASNRFLCGHSRIGMLMTYEASTNNYSDLGCPIAFNLETAYHHYGSTSQLKRVTKWRPEFSTESKPYTVQCGYAIDFSDNVQYAFSVNLNNNSTVTETYVWDNPSSYGLTVMPTKHTTLTKIYDEFYRLQIRYQHIAAFEPVLFKSHTLIIETQRIR